MPRPQRPTLRKQTTTLWYYPSAQYSDEPKGTPGYRGATPAWVIWNVLERYTRPEDLVVDPFTPASNARIRLVAHMFADVGLRHSTPFVISTDAGNQ